QASVPFTEPRSGKPSSFLPISFSLLAIQSTPPHAFIAPHSNALCVRPHVPTTTPVAALPTSTQAPASALHSACVSLASPALVTALRARACVRVGQPPRADLCPLSPRACLRPALSSPSLPCVSTACQRAPPPCSPTPVPLLRLHRPPRPLCQHLRSHRLAAPSLACALVASPLPSNLRRRKKKKGRRGGRRRRRNLHCRTHPPASSWPPQDPPPAIVTAGNPLLHHRNCPSLPLSGFSLHEVRGKRAEGGS
ncbi:hypothetical protein Taro_032979, partial [Colocasia esculenta]|nr:hypothetical protein [Colocasia esculenta]